MFFAGIHVNSRLYIGFFLRFNHDLLCFFHNKTNFLLWCLGTQRCIPFTRAGTGEEITQSIQVAKATRESRDSRRKTEVLTFCQFRGLDLADPLAISPLAHTRCIPDHSGFGLTLKISFTPHSSQKSSCHTTAFACPSLTHL